MFPFFLFKADYFSFLSLNDGSEINCIFAGIFIADFACGMNLRDLLIIYLACGAPFGVYYFLQNRNQTETKYLWLKSFFRFVFWIPFACQMVVRTSFLTNLYKHGFDKPDESDLKKELEIEEIKKILENELSQNEFDFSIYEFREITVKNSIRTQKV